MNSPVWVWYVGLFYPPVFKMWFHFLGKWRGWHFQFSTKCSQGFLWVASGLQLNNPHFKFWLKITNTEENSFISFPIKKIKIKKSGRYVDKNIGYCYWEQKGCLTYLPPFFGSHSLQIQHNHWKGKWRSRGQKGSMKKRKNTLFNLSH